MKTVVYHLMIDGSKSMSGIWSPLSKAVNKHLNTMEKVVKKNVDIEFRSSVRLFNDSPVFLMSDLDCGDLESYSPSGLTAMFDMINTNISLIQKNELLEIKYEDYMVFFVVITDGLDNRSKKDATLKINAQINKLQSSGKWMFFFLGADAKIEEINESLNIEVFRYASFNKTNIENTLMKVVTVVKDIVYSN
jgi:hypothetical protein